MKFILWLWALIKCLLLTPAPWTVKPPVDPPAEPPMEQEPSTGGGEPPEEPIVEPPIVDPPHLPPVQPNGIVLKPEWNPTQFLIPTWTDQEWLAHIIRGEARGEPEEGQIAVGNVILNRVRYDGWGDSIPKVIIARFQFTPCWNADGTLNTKFFHYDATPYMAVAQKILDGAKAIPDNYYYFSVGKARKYAQDFIQIGNHWFGKIRTVPLDAENRLIEWGFGDMIDNDPINKGVIFALNQFHAAMGLPTDGKVGAATKAALFGEIITPRLAEADIVCQCNKYCNGYPLGKGLGAGVMLLAERIFREVEKDFPGAQFFASGRVNHPATDANKNIAGGYRCEKWNTERGGAAKSKHKLCIALDVWGKKDGVAQSAIRKKIEDVAMAMNTKGGVGYGAAYIVHIDTRGRKSRWQY